jgi:hypothetical protein
MSVPSCRLLSSPEEKCLRLQQNFVHLLPFASFFLNSGIRSCKNSRCWVHPSVSIHKTQKTVEMWGVSHGFWSWNLICALSKCISAHQNLLHWNHSWHHEVIYDHIFIWIPAILCYIKFIIFLSSKGTKFESAYISKTSKYPHKSKDQNVCDFSPSNLSPRKWKFDMHKDLRGGDTPWRPAWIWNLVIT